jgi:hypothetical protein
VLEERLLLEEFLLSVCIGKVFLIKEVFFLTRVYFNSERILFLWNASKIKIIKKKKTGHMFYQYNAHKGGGSSDVFKEG